MLECLFALDCGGNVWSGFELDQSLHIIAFAETFDHALAMLATASDEISSDADIDRAKWLAGKHVDKGVAHIVDGDSCIDGCHPECL